MCQGPGGADSGFGLLGSMRAFQQAPWQAATEGLARQEYGVLMGFSKAETAHAASEQRREKEGLGPGLLRLTGSAGATSATAAPPPIDCSAGNAPTISKKKPMATYAELTKGDSQPYAGAFSHIARRKIVPVAGDT